MQKDLLNKVLEETIGKPAVKIGDILYGKKNVNEFLIAKKLNIVINQVRNILYRMAEYGLVYSMRKKDRKKGWYTYFWTLDVVRSLEFLKNTLDKKIKELQNQISNRETKRFYVCPNCNIEYSEENSLLRDFVCGECGNVLSLKDNSSFIEAKRKEINLMLNDLKSVEEELALEKAKLNKIRERKEKMEKRKKDKERAEKRSAAKKLREKEQKKNKKNQKKILKKKI